MNKPTAVTFFSGIGGADQALKNAGYALQTAHEIDPKLAAICQQNHPDTQVRLANLRTQYYSPRADLYHFSPPCQDYSTASGQSDVRSMEAGSGFTPHMITLIHFGKPDIVTIENVPNYLNSVAFLELQDWMKDEYKFETIWVHDSKDYGQAQSRKRAYITYSNSPVNQLPTSPTVSWHSALSSINLGQTKPTPNQLEAIRAAGAENETILIQRRGRRHKKTRIVKESSPFPTITASCAQDSKMKKSGHPSFASPWSIQVEKKFYQVDLYALAAIQGFPVDYIWGCEHGTAAKGIGNALQVGYATQFFKNLLA